MKLRFILKTTWFLQVLGVDNSLSFPLGKRCTLNYDFFRCILGLPQRLIGRSLTGTPRSVSSMSSALSMLMEASDSAENCILKSWIFFHFTNRALPHFCFPHSGTREGHFTRSSTGAKMCQTVSQSFSLVSLALYFFIAYLDIYNYQIYRYTDIHKIHEDPMSIFPSQTCATRCFSRCWLEHCSAQSSPARLADEGLLCEMRQNSLRIHVETWNKKTLQDWWYNVLLIR